MITPFSLLRTLPVAGLLVFLAPMEVKGFDSGHHWELTAQVLNETGFSADARQTACVSNWMLDYYSSSPTGGGRMREELSKLHCDNLYNAASGRLYLAHFLHNAKKVLVEQCGDGTSDREVLLMLGAILHVVQDLYSHSNWPETYSSESRLSGYTWFKAGGKVPANFLSGNYEPRPYVAPGKPPHHPEHGSYDGGMHKDAHDRHGWTQAYYMAYCASREFVEAFRTWVSPQRWNRLKSLNLLPVQRMELSHEVQAAYGVSVWIDASGEHGHWKGAQSGHKMMFLKSIFSFLCLSSHNARWYRLFRGYQPLLDNLYTSTPAPAGALSLVPGLNLRRTAILLRVASVKQVGKTLDGFIFGQPDFYLSGGVHYGKPPLRKSWPDGESFLGSILNPRSEPESPMEGKLNCVFRDRVVQAASAVENPWRTLVIADDALLAANGNILTFFLSVGEEDPGRDEAADISPVPGHHGVIFHYDLKKSVVFFPETGKSQPAGRGKLIRTCGDHPKSAELVFELLPIATK